MCHYHLKWTGYISPTWKHKSVSMTLLQCTLNMSGKKNPSHENIKSFKSYLRVFSEFTCFHFHFIIAGYLQLMASKQMEKQVLSWLLYTLVMSEHFVLCRYQPFVWLSNGLLLTSLVSHLSPSGVVSKSSARCTEQDRLTSKAEIQQLSKQGC